MRHTTLLHKAQGFPSFWTRSVQELKRLTQVAIKLEGLEQPKHALPLWDFTDPQAVDTCITMSDQDIGGYSSVQLQHVPASATEPAHARFSGHISNALPEAGDVQRTGYAAWRTMPRPRTAFGRQLWDVERYKYLALRVKSDGRKYKVNVQTESVEVSDLHQHRLYAATPGAWETVLIRWQDFVRTNHGVITEPQSEMLYDQVRTLGVGLTDRLSGPFEFRISRIWATNGLSVEEDGQDVVGRKEFDPRDIKMPVGAVRKVVGVNGKGTES